MNEIERLRAEMDALMARSWAQEALLLFLAQREGLVDFWHTSDLEDFLAELRRSLPYSSLSDAQICHTDAAVTALLRRLHALGEKDDPPR